MNTVTNFLLHHASEQVDRLAIIGRSTSYTYGEVTNWARRVGSWLSSNRIRSGERVLIFGANTPEMVAAIFGVLGVGAAFVPVQPNVSAEKLEYLIHDCRPAAIIVDAITFGKHAQILMQCGSLLLSTAEQNSWTTSNPRIILWSDLTSYGSYIQLETPTPDDLAAIIYTSGSTKNPKGVISRHEHIVFATTTINSLLRNSKNDIILCGLPLSFDYGLYQVFLTFQAGATLVLEPDFNLPQAVPSLLRSRRITGFPGVPTLFALLLRSRLLERIELPDLRYITSTGDVFPPTHIDRLRELLPHVDIFSMYGLTECKRASILLPGELDLHRGSVGRPLPGTTAHVLDSNGVEQTQGSGELVVRGPHVMDGYWQDSAATASRFVKDSNGKLALHTGDQFSIDEDGYLFFLGRDEMIIKKRGVRVSVTEVEVLLSGIEGVSEAVVVGLPDSVQGELILAFLSYYEGSHVNEEQIQAYCKEKLEAESCPDKFVLVPDPLPRTPNGKYDRAALRQSAIE